jgi:histidine phosphotransferase ChpT
VLEDEDDESLKKVAMELVQRSARQAAAKLQFCRIAFGAAGSTGAAIDLGEAGDTARAFVADDRIRLDWQVPREQRPKGEVKLLLNMMLIGISAVPRGGLVTVELANGSLKVSSVGDAARLPEKTGQLLMGRLDTGEIDARLVQPYYTLRLAQQSGFALSFGSENNKVSLKAIRNRVGT